LSKKGQSGSIGAERRRFLNIRRFASEVAQVLAQKWGRTTFDYLLNNAGIGLNVPFAETSEAQFDELMNIQFKGPFF
jgi:NAD(P)-dependent dehydrogenase (short-subunit alcohol dehydrogenase family)